MNARRPVVLLALLLSAACGRDSTRNAALEPIKRAAIKRTPVPVVPVDDWRPNLSAAYRLRPDSRFLLALGELDRLAGKLPAPPAAPASAEFLDGKWTVRIGAETIGTLPALPDFSDALVLLDARAKAKLPKGPRATAPPDDGGRAFLMPGLARAMRAAERQAVENHSYAEAARLFADLAFQTPDRLGLAPVIPSRALALLAAARTAERNGNALLEEEVLLAQAMDYTRHAQDLAARLPAGSPVRAYVLRDDAALRQIASRPGASEEARFLAVKRSTANGQIPVWQQARRTYLPGGEGASVAAAGTLIDLEVPGQVEVDAEESALWSQLTEAVTHELASLPGAGKPTQFEGFTEYDTNRKHAEEGATGPLWDAAIVRGFYEAAFFAPLDVDDYRWSERVQAVGAHRLGDLVSAYEQRGIPPDPAGDTRGSAVILQEQKSHRSRRPKPTGYSELHALVPWLDSRPDHRYFLADLSRYQLEDQRAGEDLLRSFLSSVGEGDRKRRAAAAIYLADWPTVRRIFDSPDLAAPEATDILWSWRVSRADRDALMAELDRTIARFPHEWNPVNYSIDVLRDAKEYEKSCMIVERWLARNTDPETPGWFHAHIRLARNFVLAKQYNMCRSILEPLADRSGPTGAWRDRGIAECLAGQGQYAEAEKLLRRSVKVVRGDSETLRCLIEVLWAQGKAEEACELLLNRDRVMAGWEVCQSLREDFFEGLDGRPAAELDRALDAIAKHPELSGQAACVFEGFGKAGRWEQAVHIAERLHAAGPEDTDSLIRLYDYVKAAKGKEAAVQWLQARIPADKRNPISMKAMRTHNDDLLWDFIGTPNPADHPDYVWLFRAVASVLRGPDAGADPHREELKRYFEQPLEGDNHVIGRYLLRLAPEEEMRTLAAKPGLMAPVAFAFGVRAQEENRLRDATDWYRVAAESPGVSLSANLAQFQLADWTAMRQGISVIQGKAGQSREAAGK